MAFSSQQRFATTQWSLVLEAVRRSAPEADAALGCSHSFARSLVHPVHLVHWIDTHIELGALLRDGHRWQRSFGGVVIEYV